MRKQTDAQRVLITCPKSQGGTRNQIQTAGSTVLSTLLDFVTKVQVCSWAGQEPAGEIDRGLEAVLLVIV